LKADFDLLTPVLGCNRAAVHVSGIVISARNFTARLSFVRSRRFTTW